MAPGADPLAMLAPNATPDFVPPQPGTPGAAPATGTPTEPTPPVTVSTAPTSPVDTVNSPQLTAMLDRESWLHRALNATASHLTGEQTYEVTPNADGTGVKVTPHTSTMGEKWGRIAGTALVGAVKGLAAGQGPGGEARAASAGFDAGAQMPQQQLANANAEAATMNAQQLAAANNAFLHQKIVTAGLQAQQLGMTIGAQQADLYNGMFNSVKDSPNAQVLPAVGSMAEIAKLQNSYADFFKTHTNDTMKVFVTPDAKGNIRFTPVILDVGYNNRKNDKIMNIPNLGVGANGEPMLVPGDNIPVGAQPMTQIIASQQAKMAQVIDLHNKWSTATGANKPDKVPTTPEQAQAMASMETDPAQKQRFLDMIPKMQRLKLQQEAAAHAPAQPGLAPAPAGTTGDAYLQAAVDPSMWSQVKAIANGDVKMPTAGMRGANQALRNAVMNYDPNFTDARYTGKQQFKTGTEATKLNQLSTGLEHLESAISHADYNPLMPFSDKATAYAEDIKHFTQESGKYIKSGALTQGEYEDLMAKAKSPIPSVRMAALNEKANLLGGKVRASFQQYRAATGQDLPTQEFFDPDTRARLTRYALTPAAAATPAATQTTAPAATPPPAAQAFTPKTPPAGQQKPGYAYGVGPKGEGWYKQ